MKSQHKTSVISLFVAINLIFATSYAQNTSLPVGTISGSADVTAMGAATYNIPIEVVPGTQGVQPNLNVVYNSMANMGILGSQWDLGGLSAITRVGQNKFLDQHSSSVMMDNSDRFALDGNRLVCNDPTLYGLNGTLYRPEFEDFSKIYSYGTIGNGPEYFLVYRDDGSVAEYGNSADSRQMLGTKVYSWYINKITDINGNYMTFSYGGSGGEIWIDHIDYTGNPTASLSPYARVKFSYDVLSNMGSTFVAGYEIPQRRLLQTITVQYKNGSSYEMVRQYQFSYSDGFPKQLTNVQLMAADGSTLNPTSVEWNGSSPQDFVDTTMIPIQYPESESKHIAIDFNKDGKCDLFVYDQNSIYFFDNQNGDFIYSNYHYDADSQWFIRKSVPADMDGDGFSELITAFTDNDKYMTYVTRTRFPFQMDTLFPVFSTNGYKDIVTGDFLGNGQNQVVVLYQGPSSSYYIQSSFQSVQQSVTGGSIDAVDFDGDGQMELMILDETTLTNFTIYKYDETLNAFAVIHQGVFNSAFRASGDFNGDGISDVLIGQSTSFYTALGTGTGFVIKPANQTFGLHNTLGTYRINPMVVDINNDGYDDVLAFNKTADGLKVVCYVGCGYYKDTVRFQNNIAPSTLPVFLESFELNRHDFTFGDFNDDHHLDLISFKTIDALHDGVLLYEFKMDKRVPQVNKVTIGDGSFVRWMYQDIYGLHYRYASHISILPYQYNVVESMTETLGAASQTNTQLYSFQKPTFSFMRMQRMGFLKISKTDVNRQKTDSLYSQVVKNDYGVSQEILMPAVQKTYFSSQLSESIEYQTQCLLFGNGKRRLPYIIKTLDTNQLDMSVITKTAIRWPHTGRLQVESTVIKNADDFYPQVTERKEYQQTTHTMPSGSFITLNDSIITETWMNNSNIKSVQKQYFTYNNRYLPEQITVVMDGVSTSKTIQNYDNYGNGRSVTDSGDSCLARTITSLYDNTGRFCVFESSGPSFNISRTFSPKQGLLLSITDENDLTTTYAYDVFDKLTAVHHPDGNTDTIRYGWYMYDEIPNAKYYSLTHVPGRTFDTERYYDLLGRNICTRENGYFTDTCYDIKGNVYRVSAPYIRGTSDANKIWHTFQYDQFGRITSEVGPYSNVSYQYAGYTTTTTDNLRQTVSTRTTDAVGRVCSVTDPGGTVAFNYSHVLYNGRIATQTNVTACGHSSQIISDASGNRLRIVDPNAGEVTCRYNAHNQPLQQTDANGNNIRFQYDEWGRLKRKTNITPSNNISEVFRYIYDHYTSSNHGQGKLYCVLRNDTLCEQYTYDTLSRLVQHIRYIDNTSYSESYAYNTYGQLATLTYPDGFATDFSYTGKRYLEEITRHDNDNRIFAVHGYNLFGQPTKCSYGNGTASKYEYNNIGLLTHLKTGQKYVDPIGPGHPPIDDLEDTAGNDSTGRPSLNDPSMEYFSVDSTIQNFRYTYDNMGRLMQRMQKNSQYETFQYDNMDRLTSFTQGNGINRPGTFTTTYDAQGNILNNTLAGTYSYDSNKPHAVTEVTPSNAFPNTISAADCETDYNVFNQPSRIAEGDMEILLEYGADNQRVKAVFKDRGYTLYTRYYISANYEKEVDDAGVTTHYNYIYGATGLAAICVRRNGVDSMYYVHPDRLGSYTHITDSSKQVIRALHFDPWGNVKSDANWLAFDSTTLSGNLAGTFRFSRGFTGHEHYADLKIINMNGRLYDPVIARFFSPDNFVQVPEFTQSYNRYSYCLNNPLQWVDPSGEDMLDPWYRDAIGIVRWTDSEFNMPIGGFFLGDEGVFTSDGEMRYYYADGQISPLEVQQVFIEWNEPSDYTFSLSSSPLRGAGFYRIGDPAEQEGNFSSNFQYVVPINPGYINGLNGLAVSMGIQYHLIEFAARSKYKSARTWREFKNLSKPKKAWRYNHSIGQSGKVLKGMSKWTGNGAAAVSMIGESVNYYNYTTTYGFDWKVTAKFGMDFAMTCIGVFGGPVGFAISTTYFILDVSTDNFSGFGKMY